VSQVRHLYILSHLFFLALVQDIKHYLCRFCYLNSVEVNILLSEFLYLLLYQATLRITLWVIVVARTEVMILGTMARGISNENCVLAVRLPILLQSIVKASCNILWTVSTTCGF
jgi:hypothetical protein